MDKHAVRIGPVGLGYLFAVNGVCRDGTRHPGIRLAAIENFFPRGCRFFLAAYQPAFALRCCGRVRWPRDHRPATPIQLALWKATFGLIEIGIEIQVDKPRILPVQRVAAELFAQTIPHCRIRPNEHLVAGRCLEPELTHAVLRNKDLVGGLSPPAPHSGGDVASAAGSGVAARKSALPGSIDRFMGSRHPNRYGKRTPRSQPLWGAAEA